MRRQVTHSGADLDTALEMAKGQLDGDLQWNCYDLLNNRNEWWVPGKIVDIRRSLEHVWRVRSWHRCRTQGSTCFQSDVASALTNIRFHTPS